MTPTLRVLLAAPDAASGGWKDAPQLARALGRADPLERGKPGRTAQCLRHFAVQPAQLAVAPLSRMLDADDAHVGCWLRCDPVHVRPDLGTARMLAHGGMLGLTAAECADLAASLHDLFAASGYQLSAPHPARWYLQLPRESQPPEGVAPSAALGDDLLAHLPSGPEGPRWRGLLNEAQIILHQHEVNRQRANAGLPTVNSLWFWGAGRLPDSVRTSLHAVVSQDSQLLALSRMARLAPIDLDALWGCEQALLDLHHVASSAELERAVWPELDARLRSGAVAQCEVDLDDGRRFRLRRGQRLRLWRRRLSP